MADDVARSQDALLERGLVRLAPYVAYPPTPLIAQTVRARLTSEAPRRSWWAAGIPFPRALAVALFAVALSVGSLLAIWPQARTAVSDRLGIRGVTVEQPPYAVPRDGGAPPTSSLDLGEQVTLADARGRAAFTVLVPSASDLGEPDEVYLSSAVPGGRVALVYGARAGIAPARETGVGLLLVEFRGPLSPDDLAVFQKQLSSTNRVEAVAINGARGLWIEGSPHVVYVPDASGQMRPDRVRLAGNVLLWEQGQVSLRLEGAISKEVALRIASSVR